MKQDFYQIEVVGIEKPIEQATGLSLQIPDRLMTEFAFKAGQHLCFKFILNGVEERRMYSLTNSPFEKGLYQVTVKTHQDGYISKYIAEKLSVGDTVEVSNPQGNFFLEPRSEESKNYYFFAAGSGITPIYSMIRSVLLIERKSTVYLLYGNRNIPDILFYKELKELQHRYSNRLKIIHTLSKRFLDASQWDGKRGRINDNMVEEFINENQSEIGSAEYFVCGPHSMNQVVIDTLTELGIPSKLIHYEYFSAEGVEYDESLDSIDSAEVEAIIQNRNYRLNLQQDETILQGLKRTGAPVPYSCQSGICGTCKARLLEGEVKMKACMALSSSEIENDVILTCQSLVQSSIVKVKYD